MEARTDSVQAVAISTSDGREIASFTNFAELFAFRMKHKLDNSFKIEYIPDSPMWDSNYDTFVRMNNFPSLADDPEEFDRKLRSCNPYYGYGNSVRSMLCDYKNKFVVLLKEGSIDEDRAGDDCFITCYVAHNMDWVSDFVRSFAIRCCGTVAIYKVDHVGNVTRLFSEETSEEYKFKVFSEKKYELFEEMWDDIGWHPTAVD